MEAKKTPEADVNKRASLFLAIGLLVSLGITLAAFEYKKYDEGELMGNKVKSFTDDLDEKLIELLLQDERSRTQFFIKIKDVYVFKASEFKFFLDQFYKKIGLFTESIKMGRPKING